MDKQERKAALKRLKQTELAHLVAGMPIPPTKLHSLLDYLDSNLRNCDHTTKLTAVFLQVEGFEKEKVLSWLAEHGGYCDCEVLANLANLDDSLQTPPPIPRPPIAPKPNRVVRGLQTATGWDLSDLPPPWRVANLYETAEPIQLQLGKKSGCSLRIVESSLPSGDRSSVEFWSRLWHARTELPPRDPLQISHNVLRLPDRYQSTLVRSPSWLPVYCWIFPETNSWHLEVRTDLNRCAGDLPQISSLVFRLTKSPR